MTTDLATITVEHQPLSIEDYEALKASMPTYRDTLICKMLFATGLRIAEVLALTPAHLEYRGPLIAILVKRGKRREKGKKIDNYERWWPKRELMFQVADYIKGHNIPVDKPIFGITYQRVHQVFRETGIKALGRPVQPHELRKLYSMFMIRSGVPMGVAGKMLGHSDPRTTQKHYNDLFAGEIQQLNERVPV